MIVRIMGEGQFEVDETAIAALNQIDAELEVDIRTSKMDCVPGHILRMAELVRRSGKPLAPDVFEPSDAVLPPPDSSLPELQELLGAEGLIPG